MSTEGPLEKLTGYVGELLTILGQRDDEEGLECACRVRAELTTAVEKALEAQGRVEELRNAVTQLMVTGSFAAGTADWRRAIKQAEDALAGSPTPEPGEPVGGKPVPAEPAARALPQVIRALADAIPSDAEMLDQCLDKREQLGRRLGETEAALTRAEGRARELEQDLSIERRRVSYFREIARDVMPPLASSVVADEATTGEGKTQARQGRKEKQQHDRPDHDCGATAEPSASEPGHYGLGRGEATTSRDDRCTEGGAKESRASVGHHQAGGSATLGRRSDDGRVEPSPLTGEEGKAERQSVGQLIDDELEARGGMTPALAEGLAATFGTSADLWLNFALANELAEKGERVDLLPEGFVDAFCSAEHLWVQGKTHEALGRLCTAVARLAQALESRAAKGGGMTPKFRLTADGWKDYGYLAAVESPYAISMRCAKCRTRWTGCWDAFECPECGEGELPQLPTNSPQEELF